LSEELKQKLVKYIIDPSKPEYQVKKPTKGGRFTEIPTSLKGELLLEEEVDEAGRLRGWITIPVEKLAAHIDSIKRGERSLEEIGLKKYVEQWRREGIEVI